jgi:hypothetical protein
VSRRVKDAVGTCEVLDVGMRTDSLKVKGMTERSSATPLLAFLAKEVPLSEGEGGVTWAALQCGLWGG